MLDGIEIWNFNSFTIAQVKKCSAFNITERFNHLSGEVYPYPLTGEYKGLKIRIALTKGKREVLILEGSLHKYFNYGEHNYNNFSFENITAALRQLEKDFFLKLEESSIHNLEIGVAFQLPVCVEEFCQQIISYAGKPVLFRGFKNSGFQMELGVTEYFFKFYDKGCLSGVTNQIRVELCCKKQRVWAGKTGIKTLANLLEIKRLKELQELLLEKLQNLIIYDSTINLKSVTKVERELLINGQTYYYWKRLKANQPETYKKKRAVFSRLVLMYGANNPLLFLQDAIKTAFNKLAIEPIPIFPDPNANSISRFSPINTRGKSNMGGLISKRLCATCGRDISHQKGTSKFCSEKYFGKDAKACRNKDSNPRNHQKRKQERLYKGKDLLFSSDTFAKLEINCSKKSE